MRAFLKPLLVLGLVLILVVAVSWFAFPNWRAQTGGFWTLVGVGAIGVLAFGKELLGVLKTWQELHEPPAKPTAKSRLPARKPRQAQTATDSADVEQAMKRSGGDQRQKVDNSTGVRQRME